MSALLRKILRSSSYQVGILFATLMLIGVIFVSYWLVVARGDTLLRESEEAVRADIRAFVTAEHLGGMGAVNTLLAERLADPRSRYFYALRSPAGTLLAGNIPAWPAGEMPRLKEGLVLLELEHELLPGTPRSVRGGSVHFDIMAKIHGFDDGHQLLVGRDIDDLEIAQFVAQTFGWIMILILVLIFSLSWGVAYYVATRFERIAATTNRIIETGNLAERLPVDSSWDDLSKLAVLLNRMLAELELRVDGIKAVSDNIAHDLRTPLMRLRALVEQNTSGEAQERLLAELDHTLDIFRSLLRISAIEAGKQPLRLATVDARALLADAIAFYEPLALEKSIQIELADDALRVEADRDLLFQAVANLLDNAIKFAGAGGHVRCRAARRGDRGVISICDSGPGIPDAQRERVLQRFERLDGSRSTPGNGLGLPLVVAIARRHGGELTLAPAQAGSARPGLCASIELPLTDRGAA